MLILPSFCETLIFMKQDKQIKSQLDIDWGDRTLCSDGNCIGVIGTDGRCKECGKPLNQEPEGEGPETQEEFDDEDRPFEDESSSTDENSSVPTDIDWGDRTLCSDGNCIGVIGTDGRCKECGKPFENA